MRTLLVRGLLVLGISTLVGLAFVPLGDSDWAERQRVELAQRRAAWMQSEAARQPRKPKGSVVGAAAGSLVKEALLMGIPAGGVILLTFGVRRWTRRKR